MTNLPPLAFLGTTELIVIGVVILVLFGAKKVPELFKGLGTGIREFKRASREVHEQLEQAVETKSTTTPPGSPAPPPPAEPSQGPS
jgi:sec-independent protein translocase protein TatA